MLKAEDWHWLSAPWSPWNLGSYFNYICKHWGIDVGNFSGILTSGCLAWHCGAYLGSFKVYWPLAATTAIPPKGTLTSNLGSQAVPHPPPRPPPPSPPLSSWPPPWPWSPLQGHIQDEKPNKQCKLCCSAAVICSALRRDLLSVLALGGSSSKQSPVFNPLSWKCPLFPWQPTSFLRSDQRFPPSAQKTQHWISPIVQKFAAVVAIKLW